MYIDNDEYIVVFKLVEDINFKSYFTTIQIMLNYGDIVGVYEEESILCYGTSIYRIDWNKYLKMIEWINVQEMKYCEYIKLYKDELTKKYPNAPLICEINDGTNSYQKSSINVAGINVTLQR